MVVPGNAGQTKEEVEGCFGGRNKKKFSPYFTEVCEGQRQMEGSNNRENVRPVRARKKGRKMRRERERQS